MVGGKESRGTECPVHSIPGDILIRFSGSPLSRTSEAVRVMRRQNTDDDLDDSLGEGPFSLLFFLTPRQGAWRASYSRT